ANADQNAEDAKDIAGPNPESVITVKKVAVPRSTEVVPSTKVAVRVTSPFRQDDATKVLSVYLSPNGVRDRDHAKVINDFLAEKQINVSITFFLNSAMYAAERVELARRLGLLR